MGTHYSRRGASGGASGGTAIKPIGNGFMAHIRGQYVGRPLYGSALLDIENGDGIGGHPYFHPVPHLGKARNIDLTVAGSSIATLEQAQRAAIRMRPYVCRIDEIVVGLMKGVPDNVNLSIWTGFKQTGEKLADITAADLAAMAATPHNTLSLPMPKVERSADYLFVYANTPNAAYLKLSFWAFGRVLIADDQWDEPI